MAEEEMPDASALMPMEQLEAHVLWHDGVARVDSATAYSPSLALSLHGTIDTRREQIDLTGTVVPWRRVNRALGRVPLLGRLFGEASGLFAIDLTVSGHLDNPEVRTSVIRSLTPDILSPFRSLLGVDDPPPAAR